jgi:putative copper export protein
VLNAIVHAVHAVLAGVWLGGMTFTAAVVSPALKAMKWDDPERLLVRSHIGKQYAKVGSANLALLALFALLDGLVAGFGATLYAEYLLLVVLIGLVAGPGAYFGRRLKKLAEAERSAGSEEEVRMLAERRRELQKISLRVS